MKRVFSFLGACIFWIATISVLWVLVLRVLPPPVTWIMAQQANEQGAVQRTWVPFDRIAHSMPMAVIAAEDQKFFDHSGFDLEAMRKAYEYNVRKKGRRTKGASTLSQQTAKNTFCWPGRTYLRKGTEAWFTILVELLWSKQRIVEVYLNIAETGKGRFGVETIARSCFKRSAAEISASQAAQIAAVLPLPRKRSACSGSARSGWILRQMNNLGDLFDPEVRERTRLELERKEARKAKRKRK
ncbi:MAG: monofunctional biosynthetic peptidoglycan transglycosylase [Flavobacteriales bacterium]|nr:monofunctional biosynthetic peptidoglycan transglycosylase [Flavobacteriales bacterium]